jgi:hypothetical protein
MQDSWGDDFIIDLAATNISNSMPLLFEHQRQKVIGNVDTFTKNTQLSVSGPFYSDIDDDAKLVATKSKRGTQYQMSMGLFDAKTDYIKSGPVTVNGQTYDAPIEVLRGGTIRESSIVILGADDQTNAQFFSKHHEDKTMANKPDVNDDLQIELSALKTQVIELTASLDLEKSAAKKAIDEKARLELQLSAIHKDARIGAIKGLFLSVGKEFTDAAAKPYLEMSQDSFDAVAGDFKEHGKQTDKHDIQMSAFDFTDGDNKDDNKDKPFNLAACADAQEKMLTEMVKN